MVDRRVSWEFLFIAIVMTGAIMGGIFYVGDMLSREKVDTLAADIDRFAARQSQQDMSRQLASILPGDNCQALDIAVEQTARDVRQLQEEVATYEQAQKIDNPEFQRLKEQYMMLLLERYVTTRQVERSCNTSVVTVLFLYADGSTCARCDDQGLVLTDVLQDRDDMLVFPLDTGLGMQPIDLLIEAYNITEYPAMVVEGTAYEGFRTRDEVASIVAAEANGTGVAG